MEEGGQGWQGGDDGGVSVMFVSLRRLSRLWNKPRGGVSRQLDIQRLMDIHICLYMHT